MQTDRLLCGIRRPLIETDQRIGVIDIGIRADDVNIFVARIPAALDIAAVAETPDQIVQPEFIGVAVVHQAPELFEVFRAAFSPPEPCAVKLVERPPDDRHTRVL